MRGEIERISPSELQLYDRNPNAGDVDAIAGSLRTNSQYRPIVVNRGTHTGRPLEVLAGNHTTLAFRKLGEADPDDERWQLVDCWVIDVDEDAAAKIVLADNRTAEFGERDDRLLAELLASLDDLDGTGYTDADLAELEGLLLEPGPALTDADDVPSIPADPITKPGDVWQLGPHRLVCGDSTDVEVMATLMGEDRAAMVWTDPPYGVSYVGGTKDALTIENDSLGPEELYQLLYDAFTAAITVCRPGAMWYVASPAGPLFLQFGRALDELGIWRQTLSWVKDAFVMSRSHFHHRHEPIFYGWMPDGEPAHPPADPEVPAPPADEAPASPDPEVGPPDDEVADPAAGRHFDERQQPIAYGWVPGAAAVHPPETRKNDTVWEFPRPRRNREHPTMKPVDLIVRALDVSSAKGALVLDMFGGSGSTLIACHSAGRVARLVELDPKYCDVICRRYQEHTGTVPVLESSGEAVDFTERDAA